MINSTSFKLFVGALFVSFILYSCKKSIDKQAAINEISTVSNSTHLNQKITPYKFERINEHNFYSQGWREEQVNRVAGVNVISTSSELVEIVCGPGNTNQRLIPGCVTMNLPTSADPTLRRIRLRKGGYSGTRLADIIEFKYSTYVVDHATANIVLQIDVTGDDASDFNMWFEPMQRSQGSGYPLLVLNTWQQWDALPGTWYIEFATVPGLPNQCTIAELVALHPDARIMDNKPQPGLNREGIYFTVGPPEYFENTIGYFDALIIGTKNEKVSTLYDFACSRGNE